MKIVRSQHEDGSALIIALVFLSVFGVLIAIVLGFVQSGVDTTIAVRSNRALSYAGAGGTDAGINHFRPSSSPCTASTDWPAPILNGVQAQVNAACTSGGGTPGVDPGTAPKRAILTLSTDNRENGINLAGGNKPMVVQGGLFSNSTIVNGGGSNSGISVMTPTTPPGAAASKFEAVGNCTGNNLASTDASNNPLPLYCANQSGGAANTANGTDPNYAPDAPSAPSTVVTTAPTCNANGWLSELFPGSYYDVGVLNGAATACSGNNKVLWLHPGVYYFDLGWSSGGCGGAVSAACTWTVNDGKLSIVGGDPLLSTWNPTSGSAPTFISTSQACKTDSTTPAAPDNDGVQLIFGGETRMDIQKNGFMQVCAPAHNSTTPKGQQIALFGLKSGATATTGPVSLKPTGSSNVSGENTFLNPSNAFTIGETPVALTADGAVANSPPSARTAGIVLSGYSQASLPTASRLDADVLRVVHKETSTVGSLKATVTPPSGSPIVINSVATGCNPATSLCLNTTSSVVENRIDLKALGLTAANASGVSVKFEATLVTSGAPGTVNLDGIYTDITYTPPAFRMLGQPVNGAGSPTGCLALPLSVGGCAMLHSVGQQANIGLLGTIYAPSAALDVAATNDTQFSGRGIISRMLQVNIPASFSSTVPMISSPAVATGCGGCLATRDVVFTAKYCAQAPASVTTCTNATPPVPLQSLLQAKVHYDDSTSPSTVTVTAWNYM